RGPAEASAVPRWPSAQVRRSASRDTSKLRIVEGKGTLSSTKCRPCAEQRSSARTQQAEESSCLAGTCALCRRGRQNFSARDKGQTESALDTLAVQEMTCKPPWLSYRVFGQSQSLTEFTGSFFRFPKFHSRIN